MVYQTATILVTGMGPGGLAAALEAAKKGYPVTIIEPRDNFTRGMRVYMDTATKTYFTSLGEGLKINENENSVQVKDVQAFLLQQLQAYPNVNIRQGKDL